MTAARPAPPSRRRCARWALLLAVLLGGCGGEPPRPNVLLVVVDTLRADHLGTYGYGWDTSPNLDALGARGAVFETCMAQSSWTMPSMISLMTSEPIFHTIWRLPEAAPALGEQMQRAGYRTGAFVANSLLHHDVGFSRGFDTWDVRDKGAPQWTARDVNKRAHEFLDAQRDAPEDAPFFLWLHYLDPHHPYTPPEVPLDRPLEEVFRPDEIAVIDAAIAAAPDEERATLAAQREGLADIVDRYDGEVTFFDKHLGDLVSRLERDGLLENTIICIVSDHGETLFARTEHPKRLEEIRAANGRQERPMRLDDYLQDEHGYWMFNELVHTPFVLAGPGVAPGQRVDALVSNLDVAPTLMELAGLKWSGAARGRSLAGPLQTGGAITSADVVVGACYENFAVRTSDGRKLVMPFPPPEMERKYGQVPVLYDLNADPHERNPLPLDARARDLLKLLFDAREADVFKAYSADQGDPETIERLREMGYIK